MFTIKLNTLIATRLTTRPYYSIISKLFKKKSQAQATPEKPAPTNEEQLKKKEQQQEEMEDEVYNYFERQRQVDTSFDFSKLKLTAGETLPENIGKGGFEEVLYWSQIAKTPEQILQIIDAFNLLAESKKLSVKAVSNGQVHLEDFKGKVMSTVYLANSLAMLQKYSRFAYHYSLSAPQFWQKVQFRSVKMFPESPNDQSLLIDIGFMMGSFQAGSNIYNHISKLLLEVDLSIDQYVKLYLTFNSLKIGQKVWIDKLLKGIDNKIHQGDQEHISAVLQPLKEAKQPPETLNHNIQKRVVEIIDKFTLHDLLKIVGYFGFQLQNQATWDIIQSRIDKLLKGKPISDSLLDNLIIKAMNSYRLSADFVRKYIIQPLEETQLKRLQDMKLLTLSALAKGLYIYELEGETKHFEQSISKLIISKVTNDINQITDQDLVKVIQDFNLTRNGSRQLYIFFQEVIRIKYLRGYGNEVNRHTIQLLLQIYGNSGMCSREMYQQLESLILE